MTLALTSEQFLNAVFDAVKANGDPLNDWERSFMRDQAERYDQYADDTRFSEKQWNIIKKVGDLYDIESAALEQK